MLVQIVTDKILFHVHHLRADAKTSFYFYVEEKLTQTVAHRFVVALPTVDLREILRSE
jgi:hypothetical protein